MNVETKLHVFHRLGFDDLFCKIQTQIIKIQASQHVENMNQTFFKSFGPSWYLTYLESEFKYFHKKTFNGSNTKDDSTPNFIVTQEKSIVGKIQMMLHNCYWSLLLYPQSLQEFGLLPTSKGVRKSKKSLEKVFPLQKQVGA